MTVIPRSVLFGNHGRPAPTLSPDGARIGFIKRDDGVANLWIGPTEDFAAAQPITRGVRTFMFCEDNATVLVAQDNNGDENWRLYAVDLATGERRLLTPGNGARATVLAHTHVHPTTVLVGMRAANSHLVQPYRLDLTTGSLDRLEDNPGYAGWLTDTDLRIRGGIRVTPAGGQEIHLRDLTTGRDHLWLDIAPEESAATAPPMFDRAGNIYLATAIGANTKRLVRVDPGGDHIVVAEHDTYDLASVYSDPHTMQPQSAVFLGDRKIWNHLDPVFGATVDALRERLDGEIGISRTAGSPDRWLVAESSDRAPTRYYRYDLPTGELAPIHPEPPALAGYTFAAMEPITFTARDGLTIHGYITFPVDTPRADLPAVLLVHGGPVLRDTWGFKPTVQWLANRGYAVIQVNFRGSAGFGKPFVTAGDREWGRAMNNDLLDAVAYTTARGWIDPKRVAIYGGSYGGYAALAAAAFTPDAFTCAIDICGPSNLITLYESTAAQTKAMIGNWRRQVGDPDTERDLLWQRSPLSRAADIRIPLLIVQGLNDPRVKVTEAEQIVAALTEAGISHEYLLFDDEGHGIREPANVERLHATIEAFLATHLGGRTEPPNQPQAEALS
ncbi:S9 family peptidase [Nocardia farcinica]|uniref:S9 family peptidase n=1 Tax=Nocardia farcinica TaxID=37329 RepID=UPI001893166C|nr:S9 family peptidase [Nocardia farcinica]MBF6422709.1 S9 family peptidase [Nocardia farcinica]MBF6434441.1 S9 family peptidase [Nocardia farcinica]MBF6505526.1 S9 family peptidase [Nocardia farcinica]